MFIQTETTPNPATLKFLPGVTVLEQGTADFASSEEAATTSPLAASLFAIQGVSSVYFGRDFISISKADDQEWLMLKPMILGVIMDHFVSGKPVLASATTTAPESGHSDAGSDGEDAEIIHLIKELLDTRIRPAVARDGGDITFMRFEDGVVWLSMRGACAGCPSSTATLKTGIESMLRHYIPEVMEVRAA